jgi:ribosomal protein S18 acetylase RimI-like enzyme
MSEERLRTASVGDIDALVGLWEAAGLGFRLLVEPDNTGVVAFYERYGYQVEELIFMEKFL